MPRKSIPMDYTEEEIIARREDALKRMLSTPPRPHANMKLGLKKEVAESINNDSTAANKKGGRRPSKVG
jgi:hypothetical protein